jgi:hypothetical protein
LFGAVGGRGVAAIGAEEHELLAAIACGQVAGLRVRFEKLGEALDGFVPRLMAVVVVDLLEAIDVGDDQAARHLPL